MFPWWSDASARSRGWEDQNVAWRSQPKWRKVYIVDFRTRRSSQVLSIYVWKNVLCCC